ncbi:MAG: glycoside hydrolase family 15 protein [Acidimicrobiales bacterium]
MNGIGDYGVIGDCHSLALVGRDGSIDWCCFPRFDSPSVLGRVLDDERGGNFSVAPGEEVVAVERSYLPATMVLATRFETASGLLEVTDCMPVAGFDPEHPAEVTTRHAVLRRVRCLGGGVTAEVRLDPRPEYGAVRPRFTRTSDTSWSIVGGPDALWVRATRPVEGDEDGVAAAWSLAAGQEEFVEMAWTPAAEQRADGSVSTRAAFRARFGETVAFWEEWFAGCRYEGEHARTVHRSALVLKALTYAPTGAVVAAGTTSLPEWIGGGRNWDYRFTWIRDATLTLTSLVILGSLGEAAAFKGWLERTGSGRPEDLQIMYRVTGERLLPEVEFHHLDGHRGSRPVRVGNAAAGQVQLDSYGQLLEAAWGFVAAGGELTTSNCEFLARVAERTVESWRHPDHGMWEIRDEPRHFVHSKLNCWVALDRAVRMVRAGQLSGPVARWERERDLVADWLRTEGSPDGWFVQAAGRPVADASSLLVPALGFLPVGHPDVTRTVETVTRDLSDGTLVRRYLDPDGLEGAEGAFLLCSFWLLDCLIHAGRLDEADELIESLLGLANDVGIFSEMVDPTTGEALGNTPQAFTHMAVVTSADALTAARQGRLPPPDTSYAFAMAALARRR